MKALIKNTLIAGSVLLASSPLYAADYVIDTKGAHAAIEFRMSHLGYSWLTGRFNTFEGEFSYDEKNPNASQIEVRIDTTSIDSNHAERDKHLRSGDFLDTSKFPTAKFVSTAFTDKGDGKATLTGNLTLHGQTKEITLDVSKIGQGDDPWGGYRAGFEGTTELTLSDFGMNTKKMIGTETVYMDLYVEGIRQ